MMTAWVFDQKRDFRHAAKLLPDLYALRLDRDLRINPLSPWPDGYRTGWFQTFWDLFCQGEDLLSGSKAYGLVLLRRLLEAARGEAPTLFDLLELAYGDLKRYPPSTTRGRYVERVVTRLEGILVVLGDTFGCVVGHAMEDLVRANLVFEMDQVERTSAQFALRLLLSAACRWRMEHRPRGVGVEQVIVIDEAPNVASELEEQKTASGVPHIDELFQQAAEFGVRFLVCSQTTRLAYAIGENCATSVVFNMPDGRERKKAGERMSLTEEQTAALLGFGPGTAVVHLAGRCPPIVVQVDHVRLIKDVTDEQVARHVAPFLARLNASVVPARRELRKTDEQAKPGELRLAHEDEALLRHVCDFPALSWTERANLLREQRVMRATAAQKAMKRLKNVGLLEAVSLVKGGGRGSAFVGLVLTPAGREHLRKQQVRVGRAGRGNAKHHLLVDIIRAWHEGQGLACEVEAELPGGVYVDVLVRGPDGERSAFEIESGTESAVHNVTKLACLGLYRVVLVCETPALLEAVRRKITAELGADVAQSVDFAAVQQFMEPAGPEP